MISNDALQVPALPDGPVLVAVSGGADSTALLHLLHRRLDPARHPLVVAHLHHGIRGSEADEDARFVETLTQGLGLTCVFGREEVPAEAERTGESIEMAARRLRHDFLRRTAAAEGCVAIATGHTADDQIETLLLRLARGTSLRGVGGIKPAAAPRAGGVPVIRPLLGLRHAQLCAWLVAESLPWREDVTNAADDAVRNAVRHHVVPAFEKALGAAAVPSALRSMALLREDDAYLQSLADAAAGACAVEGGGLRVVSLQAQPLPLFRRIVATWLYDAGLDSADVSLTALDRVGALCAGSEAGTRDATLGGGWIVRRCNGALSALPPASPQDALREAFCARFAIPAAATTLGPFRLAPDAPAFFVRFSPGPLIRQPRSASPLALPQACTIDAALAGRIAVLRPPRPGDRVAPAGSGITQKLSDILTNLKVPRARRSHVPVLALEDGTVLWLPGHAVAEAAAVRGGRSGIQIELVRQ